MYALYKHLLFFQVFASFAFYFCCNLKSSNNLLVLLDFWALFLLSFSFHSIYSFCSRLLKCVDETAKAVVIAATAAVAADGKESSTQSHIKCIMLVFYLSFFHTSITNFAIAYIFFLMDYFPLFSFGNIRNCALFSVALHTLLLFQYFSNLKRSSLLAPAAPVVR